MGELFFLTVGALIGGAIGWQAKGMQLLRKFEKELNRHDYLTAPDEVKLAILRCLKRFI